MVIERHEVKKEDKWDVEALYASISDWESEFKAISDKGWGKILQYKGKLGENLGAALRERFSLDETIDKLVVYGHLRYDEDLTNAEHKSTYDRAMSLYFDFSANVSWFEPEILQLPDEVIESALNDNSLSDYHFFLSSLIKLKPHTLSPKEEKILALSAESMQTAKRTFSLLNNADFKFAPAKDENGEEHEITHARYSTILHSKDRTLRINAFENLQGRYREYGNTIAELLAGHVNTHICEAKARGYKSSLDAALFPKNIDTEVYRQLIKTAHENIEPLHRYMAMRKEKLGLDKLRLCDLYVPLVDEVDLHYTYDESIDMVVDSLKCLGPEYQRQLKAGLTTDRWVDRYENEGKRSGAYSSGCYGYMPYILMNYQGQINDVMTLTHEAGHSMHSFYSQKNQPYPKAQYTIFVAEVASTFHEKLLFHYLMERLGEKEKQFLINYRLDSIRATFFRQALFAEFELKIHELAEAGKPLTQELLSEIYGELNRVYYGPHLEIDEYLKAEWMRIPHFYSNFYVYQYATGISAATALVDRVTKEGAKEDYLRFISSGGSDYPLNELRDAGIDMTDEKPIKSLIADFEELLDAFRN
ncbi:MAG: oligoendopeptidase F [Candidatus Algichlamydia australiensis]|nr:oligoendopeptidase F [Chlamydiales bacterium]